MHISSYRRFLWNQPCSGFFSDPGDKRVRDVMCLLYPTVLTSAEDTQNGDCHCRNCHNGRRCKRPNLGEKTVRKIPRWPLCTCPGELKLSFDLVSDAEDLTPQVWFVTHTGNRERFHSKANFFSQTSYAPLPDGLSIQVLGGITKFPHLLVMNNRKLDEEGENITFILCSLWLISNRSMAFPRKTESTSPRTPSLRVQHLCCRRVCFL